MYRCLCTCAVGPARKWTSAHANCSIWFNWVPASNTCRMSFPEANVSASRLREHLVLTRLVAILGIINALTVSITDRRRELGVLQAVGALRNQIRLTIWMEAVAIGVIGLVLGLGLGAIQLWYSVEVTRRDIIGINIGYAYPLQHGLGLDSCAGHSRSRACSCGKRRSRIAGGGFRV